MVRFNKILCSTDFSEPSYAGLDAACELARSYSGQLILVHVVEPIPTAAVPIGDHSGFNVAVHQRVLKDNAEQSMRQLVNERIPQDVPVKTVIAEGDPANQIVQVAESEQADLIVIATHGRTGWRHVVYGSVAERVVRQAGAAVLSIRMPRAKKFEPVQVDERPVASPEHDWTTPPEAVPGEPKPPERPL
jgi:nucleotide-binding universal stress UspA family protein